MDNQFSKGVFQDLNTFRTNPSSNIKRFEDLKTAMTRFKGQDSMITELSHFIEFLSTAEGFHELNLSKGLTRAAELQLTEFEQMGGVKPAAHFEAKIKPFVSGYTNIFELVDEGADDIVDVMNKLLLTKADRERFNRKAIFDKNYNYVGIAHRLIKKQNVTIIILADNIVEKDVDHEILEYINKLRVNPIENSKEFSDLSEGYLKTDKKDLATESQKLADYFTNGKPTYSLKHSEILSDLSKKIVEDHGVTNYRLSNLFNDYLKFTTYVKRNYSEFNFLYPLIYTSSTPLQGDKLIQQLLITDPRSRKELIDNKHYKNISVNYLADDKEKTYTTIILLNDHIELGEDKPIEEKIQEELTKLRHNPKSYINKLENLRNEMKNFPSKKEFVKELDTLIDQLSKVKHDDLPRLQNVPEINNVANEYLEHLQDMNAKSFFPQDEEYLKISLNHYITGFTKCKQVNSVNHLRTENIIFDLLVNENDEGREARKAILSDNLLFFGAGSATLGKHRVNVLILTDKADKIVYNDKSMVEGLLEEINNMRAHPRSYAKYFTSMTEIVQQSPKLKTKFQRDTYLQDLYLFIDFLKKTRTFGPLIKNENLERAAKARLDNFIEDGKVKIVKSTDEDLRAFLSDFGSNYNFVCQMEDFNSCETPRDILVNLLTSSSDPDRHFRKNMFNKLANFSGIAHNDENSLTVVMFADQFEETQEKINISIHQHRRLLIRPNLTDDEILQIKKDFKNFDVLNTGFIKPSVILLFADKTQNFATKNPIYYEALTLLNTDENNSNGVDVEEFINGVKNVISKFTEKEWKQLFSIYDPEANIYSRKKNNITAEVLKNVTKQLGYKISDEEATEIFENLAEGRAYIDQDKFSQIMTIVENFGKRAK